MLGAAGNAAFQLELLRRFAAGAGHLVVAVGFQVGERLRPRGERLLVHPRFDRRAAERDVEQADRYAEPCTNHASEEISDAGELVERVGGRANPADRLVEVAPRSVEVEPDGDLAVAQQRVGFARILRRVTPAQEFHLVFHIRLSRADEHLARVDVVRDHRFVAAVDPHLQPVGAAGLQRIQLHAPGSIVTDRRGGGGAMHTHLDPSVWFADAPHVRRHTGLQHASLTEEGIQAPSIFHGHIHPSFSRHLTRCGTPPPTPGTRRRRGSCRSSDACRCGSGCPTAGAPSGSRCRARPAPASASRRASLRRWRR